MHEKGDGLKQEEISNLAAELTDLKAEGAWVCWLRSHWGCRADGEESCNGENVMAIKIASKNT